MDLDLKKQAELSDERKDISSDEKKYNDLSKDNVVENSDEKRYCDLWTDNVVESVGLELKETLTNWSNVLRQYKNIEDEALGQLDSLLKQAYLLEASCLKQRLEAVTKFIEK